MCLHLAAHGAGIRKRFDSGVFRRMKVKAFQEAGVGPYVVISTIGWTKEFGMVKRGCMGVAGALEEAARVLGEDEEVGWEREGLEMVEEGGKGFLRRFVDWMLE